jgi:Kae1-associated kinase Bud32
MELSQVVFFMIIRRGAEAEIHLLTWLGRKAIAKHRVPKGYRIRSLDDTLRTTRTKKEAKLISEARRIGISTPIIYDINLNEHKIIMEYIHGPRLKDLISELDMGERKGIFQELGRAIGRLHNNDIIHGDLTTSNLLMRDKKLYFIDFSLGDNSEDIESKGVDLHLLMEAFESTHPEYMDEFEYILQGYKEEYSYAQAVIKKIDEIIKRGRYT